MMFNLGMINRIIGLLLFVLLYPFFLFVSLIIYIDDGFPVFFRQKRIGINNSKFWIYKFRTMKKGIPDIPTHLVDRNQLVGQVMIQPTRTAEFIVLDFTIQRTGAAFPEQN